MNETVHPLRRWRKANGVTLTMLASMVGVTPSHLSDFERGRNGASMALLKRLHQATDGQVEIAEIVEAAE